MKRLSLFLFTLLLALFSLSAVAHTVKLHFINKSTLVSQAKVHSETTGQTKISDYFPGDGGVMDINYDDGGSSQILSVALIEGGGYQVDHCAARVDSSKKLANITFTWVSSPSVVKCSCTGDACLAG